jgi:hypothetical protein
LEARLTTLPCKKIYCFQNLKKVKTGCNLAESSNDGYGFNRDVLPMMMTMMMKYNIME